MCSIIPAEWQAHMQTAHERVGKEGIMAVAENLFRERGFRAVSLADIARATGIRKPSIYHHFPGGKEALFVAVQEEMFARIGSELAEAMATHPDTIESQLMAALDWFLSRPPMFVMAMMHHDMPGLSAEHRERLVRASYNVIMRPLVEAVERALNRAEVRPMNPHLLAGSFLSLLEGNIVAHQSGFGGPVREMAAEATRVLLHGALAPRDAR